MAKTSLDESLRSEASLTKNKIISIKCDGGFFAKPVPTCVLKYRAARHLGDATVEAPLTIDVGVWLGFECVRGVCDKSVALKTLLSGQGTYPKDLAEYRAYLRGL